MSKTTKGRVKIKSCFTLISVWIWALLVGCLPSPQPDRPPGYLVIALESNPTHLDPRYATDANSARIGELIFNSLTRTDKNSRLQPDLAERWEMVDELTYLFYLRKGVTFHNGKPLTAADVKFTYESVLEPKNQSPKRGEFQALKAVDQIGPYLIRFRLAAPYAPFLENSTLGIVPAGSPTNRGSGKSALIGSGPFSLEDFSPGERVVLKANPSYWEGPPSVSGLVFRIIPDAIVRALEFKKGTVDFLQNDLEPDMLPWLKKNTDASILTLQGTIFQYIGTKLDHPILKSQEVRRAIAYAVDREAVIRHLLKGLATPATGLLSPFHWAYEPSVAPLIYNPEEAKRLLDKAGFPDPDGEGPLPRFKLSYKTTTLDLRRRIAEAFKEQLDRVGIELEVRSYEWGTFYGDIKKGNFHLYSLSWVGISDPDIYFNLFHSSSIPPYGNNRGRYQNPEIDRLLEKGRKSLSLEERKRIYSRVQKILALELPYIPLWWTKNVVVMKPTVNGFIPYPDGGLISLKNVSFSPSLDPPA
ncbi:MAG: ABC transporter substrate-binding protein [Deltaproteobacteria bacterium]|nr:ABC transporter substrate-binding protein [Deltaproteobacteria bacterium]